MTVSQRDLIRAALSESERVAFEAALQAEGLDDEIALLRLWLREAFREEGRDPQTLSALMATLVRAVAQQYRMSPKASKRLSDKMAALANELGDLLAMPDS